MGGTVRRFRFRVLGAVDLRDARGREVTSVLAQPRRLALLTYLALAPAGEFSRRAALASLFWPEADDAHARGPLRSALVHRRGERDREKAAARVHEPRARVPRPSARRGRPRSRAARRTPSRRRP
jgi:hypothetical protein